ncbi:MAG: hypothetical protein A2W26_07220 [Acidobacteria bacterium RBG_16_64_8]|nr:MAG: hypothetical protein A2W26_07220 [Acidobacteria bacterium RBG_16_64_8]
MVFDWEMPGMDGVEVCRNLRARHSDRPAYVILLTGRSSKDDVVAGLDAGANDYLGKPFDPDELRARVQVGRRFVELYDELLETQRALEVQARTDALTQMMNRRAVLARLREEMGGNGAGESALCIAILDIDHFKQVNDEHGHVTGDAVLCEVARRSEAGVRPGDVVGRFGGEEFLVLMPGASADEARAVLEGVRRRIEATPIEYDNHPVHVTASLGGTSAIPGEAEDEILVRADEALYRAKALGRNRVEMAA